MKKFIILLILFYSINIIVLSRNLPQPQNNQLYTEFNSVRTAPYLKRSIKGSGYIAMDGKEKILFKQEKPLNIEVRKTGIEVTFKRGKMEPINIDLQDNDIMLIFSDVEKLQENYTIDTTKKNNKDTFRLTPKKETRIKEIIIISNNINIEKLEIFYKDKSTLVYTFHNTITGIKPDERLF